MKTNFLITLSALVGWLSFSACNADAASLNANSLGKLNVVFILIDDLGWTDLGCYGSQ